MSLTSYPRHLALPLSPSLLPSLPPSLSLSVSFFTSPISPLSSTNSQLCLFQVINENMHYQQVTFAMTAAYVTSACHSRLTSHKTSGSASLKMFTSFKLTSFCIFEILIYSFFHLFGQSFKSDFVGNLLRIKMQQSENLAHSLKIGRCSS